MIWSSMTRASFQQSAFVINLGKHRASGLTTRASTLTERTRTKTNATSTKQTSDMDYFVLHTNE